MHLRSCQVLFVCPFYLFTGYTYSYGAGFADIYLVKTDRNGNEQWSKTFGGSDGDIGYSVQQTNDGGFIIVGTFILGSVMERICLIKTDNLGVVEWEKTYHKLDGTIAYSGHQTADNGYIICGTIRDHIAGFSKYDVLLLKTDEHGNEVWFKVFNAHNDEYLDWDEWGHSVHQTADGGYIMTGTRIGFYPSSDHIFLLKTDQQGNKIWETRFDGEQVWASQVQQTSDNGYVVVGSIQAESSQYDWGTDTYLIKTDENGIMMWQERYNLGTEGKNVGWSILQTEDSGYVICGGTRPNYGFEDLFLLKTDGNGLTEWSKIYSGDYSDCGFSVKQTHDRGFIIVGDTDPGNADSSGSEDWIDMYVIKTDENGDVKL